MPSSTNAHSEKPKKLPLPVKLVVGAAAGEDDCLAILSPLEGNV